MERTRKPTSPGQIIKAHYLEPLGMSIEVMANALNIPAKTLSDIIDGKEPVTIDIAMRLSRALSTSPELWINLQTALDLWEARQKRGIWDNIQPLPIPVEA